MTLKIRTVNLDVKIDAFLQNCVKIGVAKSVSELLRMAIWNSLPDLMERFDKLLELNRISRTELLTSVLGDLRKNGYTIKKKHEGRSRLCNDMGNPYWQRVLNGDGMVEYIKIGDWAE